jgi:hypothetical protein
MYYHDDLRWVPEVRLDVIAEGKTKKRFYMHTDCFNENFYETPIITEGL